MRIALVTTYPSDYRLPLYRLLAARDGLEVLCYGRGARYAPAWSADLDAQLAAADFPARRIDGPRAALTLGREYDAVIAPFAGGSMLPAAYVGAKRFGTPFVLWASVWHQPRSVTHALALPVTRHIYRHADAVIAYGEHVRRFAAQIRGRDDDIFIAPQAVERDLFGRHVDDAEIAAFRAEHELGDGPLVLYTGRLVAEKGIEVLAEAWPRVTAPATLVLAGDGPLRRVDAFRPRRPPARSDRPRPARRRLRRRAVHGRALDPDAALQGAVGPGLQRGVRAGPHGDRDDRGRRRRRRARPRRRDGPRDRPERPATSSPRRSTRCSRDDHAPTTRHRGPRRRAAVHLRGDGGRRRSRPHIGRRPAPGGGR